MRSENGKEASPEEFCSMCALSNDQDNCTCVCVCSAYIPNAFNVHDGRARQRPTNNTHHSASVPINNESLIIIKSFFPDTVKR